MMPVSALVDACEKNNLEQPIITTESGRSLTAHHSVLIFEAACQYKFARFR